jgi:hypothetical protein
MVRMICPASRVASADMTAYVPAAVFRRTDAERRDQELAWNRPDQAFFAAGACHILAWTFLETYPDAGFQIVALRKLGDEHPCHVIATDNHRAFDHAGWTRLERTPPHHGASTSPPTP